MIFDNFACQEDTPEAYETLLLDALLGDLTLFMRSDQVEEAWDVVKTIQEAWANEKDALSRTMKPEAGVRRKYCSGRKTGTSLGLK
jgi:glucose-6-phosphate 1-dehydrogenase